MGDGRVINSGVKELTHLCLNSFSELFHHEFWMGPLYSQRGVIFAFVIETLQCNCKQCRP